MKKNKLKKILSTFAVSMMIISTIAGCSKSGSNVTDNNQNLNNALIIEKAAMIPVIDGRASSTGVYIHNTSNQTIRGISYGLVSNNSKTSLTLNQASCNSIAANSSCLLPLTTPALTAGNSGSNILVVSYNNQQSKQLLNYRYIKSSDYSGVNFSDNSQSLFGTNDYATVYVFVGNSQAQNNVGFANSSDSLAISNGLTNGKVNIPANTVIPLEIHSNQNVTASIVTVTPYTVTSTRNLSKALTAALQNNSQLQVTITPTMQANLLMSNLPILSQNESTATLAIVNNGNQSASNINLTAADNSITVGSATTNPCTEALAVGASCNYQITLNNHDNNGTTLITLDYNNSLIDTSTTQNVYYLNNNAEPMVAVVPTQSSFTEQVSTNQNITFNLNNLGNVPLNNLIPKINTTLGHTTVTIQNNNCGNTLAAKGNCQIQLNVAASGLIDSGIIYLNISGTYTGSSAKSYSFMSKPVYITITDPSNPTVTSTTPQDTTTGVSKATGIVINFSEPMTPTTLTSSNIKLQKVSGSSDVPLTAQGVTGNNQTVTFTHADLTDTTQYKIVINPSQIKNINGNAISNNTSQIISTFTTADSTSPTISSVTPANGATNQSKTPAITITFSEAMDQNTLTPANIMLANSVGGAVSGYTVNYDTSNHVATLNLTGALTEQTSYILSINQLNVKDTSGNAMGSNSSYLVSQFTTGDFTAPTLSSTIPINRATGVADESAISLTFSESMDITTLSTTTVKLQKVSDSSYVSLNSPSYSNGNKTVTFQPSANLFGGESYNIIINPSQIKDLAGNPMSADSSQTVSNFMTFGAMINISPLSATSVTRAGGSVTVQATLDKNIEQIQTVTLSTSNINDNINISSQPSQCQLKNANESCVFTITTASQESSTPLGYTTLIFQNSGNISLSQNQLQLLVINPYIMYFAHNGVNGYTGDLLNQAINKGASGINNGIAGADYLCNHDESKPASLINTTYKAMIVDGTNRQACYSADCIFEGLNENIDWVLKPMAAYKNTADMISIITNESASYPFIPNYLTPSVTQPSLAALIYLPDNFTIDYGIAFQWTGLSEVWTMYPPASATNTELCSTLNGTTTTYWDNSSNIGTGNVGNQFSNSPLAPGFSSPTLTLTQITAGNRSCAESALVSVSSTWINGLICVQQ